MNETNNNIQRLITACELRSEEDFDIYSQSIAYLHEHQSEVALNGMLTALREVDAGEIQYELIEACEAYPDEQYVRAFANKAEEIRAQAPTWGEMMLQSVMNSESCRSIIRELYLGASSDRYQPFWDWIQSVSLKEPQYKGLVRELQKIIG